MLVPMPFFQPDERGRYSAALMLKGFAEGDGADLYYPAYKPVDAGDWQLQVMMSAAARGFWGHMSEVLGMAILTKGRGKEAKSWMSMTLHEVQSQEVGVRAAKGHTVIFGLGMGWSMLNAAMRPETTKVTVVERDPAVIAMIEELELIEDLPDWARTKIEIVEADAYEWRPSEPVDSFQPDIWRPMMNDERVEEVHRMQANVQAKEIYFWGQENEIWRHACRRRDGWARDLSWEEIRDIVANDIRLPLILPDYWPDYPERIADGVSRSCPQEEGWWRKV